MITILIIDDHPIVRKGLKETLEESGDVKKVLEAGNSEEALTCIREGDAEVVLLDVSLPGRGGLEILKQIKSIRPDLPVLMLSMHPEDQYAVRALKAGASGYITKTSDTEQLLEAIRRVASGRKYVSETLAEKLAFVLDDNSNEPLHKKLSDREFEVFRELSSGNTVSEISDKMSLSVKTISTYRSRILEKMNMKNNAELTRYAIKNEIVD